MTTVGRPICLAASRPKHEGIAMQDVKYLGEDGRYDWPHPFEADAVAVSIIDATGRERLLTPNKDFLIAGPNVLCPCPAGSIIHIREADSALAARTSKPSLAQVAPEYQRIAQASAAQASAQVPASVAPEADEARLNKIVRDIDETIAEADSRIGKASLAAEKMALDAGERASAKIAADAEQIRAKCEAIYHKCFLEASRVCSWAVQISQYHSRPGVSTVKSEAEIPGSMAGLCVVNPHITHSPTPFMGVWPVRDLCSIQWEGLFFFGHPYDGDLTPPPPFLVRPPLRPEVASGDGDDWTPCDHPHIPAPRHPPRPPRPPLRWGPKPCAYPPCDCGKDAENEAAATESQEGDLR